MPYLVTIQYAVPKAAIEPHLPAHRAWLMTHARSGRFIVAGPLADHSGGVIVADCDSREQLDSLLAQDAYQQHGVARYTVQAFNAALRAAAFPAHWAPDAKAA